MRLFPSLRQRLAGSDIRAKLWMGGGIASIPIITLLVANAFLPADRAVTWDMLGHDFLALYYGGYCAYSGHSEQLYDLPATRAFEARVGHAAGLSLGKSFGPWWNPPFAAWMFAPFAAYPYMTALHAWWTASAICMGVSILILMAMLRGSWKTRLLVPVFMLSSMPGIQTFCHGQNTAVSLLMLTTTVYLWRTNRPLLAGIVCGLLFYKPQLGAVVAAVLCLTEGRRAILGVCLTGTTLVLVNILTMPGTLHEFIYHMPQNLRWIQEQNTYLWERHVTLKAFWRFTVQKNTIGPTTTPTRILWCISEIALLAGLACVAICCLRSGKSSAMRDRLIAATICAMPLLMPFYFDYDLLLLAVGIVVYAAERQIIQPDQSNWEDRWLIRVWALILLVMMVWKLPHNPLVPLLAAGAVLLIRHALRPIPRRIEIWAPQSLPAPIAA